MAPRCRRLLLASRIAAAFLAAAFFAAAIPAGTPKMAYDAASAEVNRSNWPAAKKIIDDALTRFGRLDDDDVWRLRILRGYIYLVSDPDRAAAEAWLSSFQLPERLRNSDIALNRLMYLANARRQRQNLEGAAAALTDAQRIAEKHFPGKIEQISFERANLDIARGDYAAAEPRVKRMIAAAKKQPGAGAEARAWGTLGLLRGKQQRWAEAIRAQKRAESAAIRDGKLDLADATKLNLAWNYYAVADYETAEATAKEVDAFRKAKGGDRVVPLLLRGNAALGRQRLAEARQFYEEARQLAEAKHHASRRYAYGNLALVEVELRDYDNARLHNQQAMELKRAAKDVDGEHASMIIDARIAYESGDHTRPFELLQSVVDGAAGKQIRWTALAYLGQLYAREHDVKKAESAFARAVATFDDERQALDDDAVKLTFPTLVLDLFNQYIEMLASSGRVEEALRVAELGRARTLADALKVKYDAKDFDVRKGVAGFTVIEYALQSPRSYAWVVKQGTVEMFPLEPAETIEKAIDEYQLALRGQGGSLEHSGGAGSRLYSMLVAPFASRLPPNARIAIVADGRLNTLNLETLVVPGKPPHYWIEDVTIEYAPSLRLLTQGSGRSAPAGSMLLVGNPPIAEPEFPPLPAFAQEMALVKAHFPGAKTLSEKGATPRAYLSSTPGQYAYLHFVAHAVARMDRPLESAIILGNDGETDRLYARDIVGQPLTARLVTIASCHGAGKRAYEGEGLVGLAWAFLRAGARQVVASLFVVDDRATAELMDSMYTSMKNGSDAPSALRQAKLKLLQRKGVQRYPRYWAPFVVYSGR
jgi:CHAT domain-containing protein